MDEFAEMRELMASLTEEQRLVVDAALERAYDRGYDCGFDQGCLNSQD